MRYALFMGCTIPARGRNYEMSVRAVAGRCGLELVDLPDFSCCGFPVKSSHYDFSFMLAMRNLALAEREKLDIMVLCNACTASLTEVAHELAHDPRLKEEGNRRLQEVGLSYAGPVRIRHFARVLYEDVGCHRIRGLITRDLSSLTVAPHYGCHYLKPSSVYEGFDDAEAPSTLEALIAATGVQVVSLKNRKHCCGGGVLAADADVAADLAGEKLSYLKEREHADALCLSCPFCTVMYDDNQKKVEARIGRQIELPVLYYSQLLGLALGLDPNKELGFNMNKVKAAGVLQKIEAQ